MSVLADLLRSAHGCVYAYGVIAAYLTAPGPALDALAEHRRMRDALIAECQRLGVPVPPAAVAYALRVTDEPSARALAAQIENGTCARWAAALSGLEEGFAVQHAAFAVDCAVRGFMWSGVSQAFPH